MKEKYYNTGSDSYFPSEISNVVWDDSELKIRFGTETWVASDSIDIVRRAFIKLNYGKTKFCKLYRDDAIALAQLLEMWLEYYTQGYFSTVAGTTLCRFDRQFTDKTTDEKDLSNDTKVRLKIHIDSDLGLLFDINLINIDGGNVNMKNIPTFTLRILIMMFTSFATTSTLFCNTEWVPFRCAAEDFESMDEDGES